MAARFRDLIISRATATELSYTSHLRRAKNGSGPAVGEVQFRTSTTYDNEMYSHSEVVDRWLMRWGGFRLGCFHSHGV